MIAEVAAGTLNCSAANFKTAVNGVSSGTFKLERKYRGGKLGSITHTLNGRFGSDVKVILNLTFDLAAAILNFDFFSPLNFLSFELKKIYRIQNCGS